MAELLIRVVIDPETGERRVVIDYASDADALPMEHEEEHRRLARALVSGAGLERAPAAAPTAAPTAANGEERPEATPLTDPLTETEPG